jgi:hypothetical protein
MLPQPKQSNLAMQNDAEFECYLCLAASLQALQRQQVKSAAERKRVPGLTLLSGLQAFLRGLRKADRRRAA